jgi:hypothetical protein
MAAGSITGCPNSHAHWRVAASFAPHPEVHKSHAGAFRDSFVSTTAANGQRMANFVASRTLCPLERAEALDEGHETFEMRG